MTLRESTLARTEDSVCAAFDTAVVRFADRPFLAMAGGDRSFADVQSLTADLTARYRLHGLSARQRLGLILSAGPEIFLHFLALNRLGVSVVPISPDVPVPERDALLARAQVAGVISQTGYSPLGTMASAAPGEAALLFTSGTSGAPKGCILGNDYFTHAGRFYAGLGGLCAFAPGGDRIATPLPPTHMNALACSFMVAIETGSCLIQLPRFSASAWWPTVRESGATVVHYLGVMPAILLSAAAHPDDRNHRVRFGFGAGVDPRHHVTFEDRFGFPLIEAWAMTETGAGAWITASHEPRHRGTRCFGIPPAEVETRIVDEAGADAETGELLVRHAGPDPRRHFFSGYDNDPEATETAWTDGWFHSGDIVRRGPDGSLHFVDRQKNIIRRSGENIAAVEVEGVLMQHAAVRACVVLPVPDEMRGDEVMILVVTDQTPDRALAEALHDHAAAALAYFKAPGWVAFVEDIPRTASQKIQRQAVRMLGRTLVEHGAAFDLRTRKRRSQAE